MRAWRAIATPTRRACDERPPAATAPVDGPRRPRRPDRARAFAGGWGIANERKWGYWLAVVIAVLLLVDTIVSFSGGVIITLLFEIVLVALLVHPQSREYRRIWFK